MGTFVPTTAAEREQMLRTIGASSVEELFRDVPQQMYLDGYLNLPPGKSEQETFEAVSTLAEQNHVFKTCLRGAGSYRHYIPAAVKAIVTREEFVTAYTPYQAEISQGILQGIFEYQTMLCELTGMDVSNAGVYDGGTAAAEAIPMCRDRKRTRAYVSAAIDPNVLGVMKTYCFGSGTELIVVPMKNGKTDPDALRTMLGADAACFYVQQPNFFGLLEDAELLGEITHAAGAKYIMGVNPISLAILKTPGECGADIAVGEGQPLGLDTAFGGEDRLCPHAFRAGAAHPPGKGLVQHLLERTALRADCRRLSCRHGRSRTAAGRGALHVPRALFCAAARRSARLEARLSRRILPRIRDRLPVPRADAGSAGRARDSGRPAGGGRNSLVRDGADR